MNLIDRFIYSENKGVRISRHVLFWSGDFFSYLVFISYNTPITSKVVLSLFSRLPLIMSVVYFILYYLIPNYSHPKKRLGLFLWVFCVLIVIGLGFRLYGYYVVNQFLHEDLGQLNLFKISRIVRELLSWLGVVMLAIAIKLMKTKNQLQQRNDELLREKRIAELSFLKAQMHPHFLFNTLNTLYSDAIKTDSKSEQIVLRLSNLMRFILEECNKPLIPLGNELKVIDDYIELEKLRHGSRLEINFKTDVKDPSVLISPLLLLPFVENSFKHTLHNQRGTIPILIRLSSTKEHVMLFVENDLTTKNGNGVNNHSMGIRNMRKQLELLFGTNYKLDISSNGKYAVSLQVPNLNHE